MVLHGAWIDRSKSRWWVGDLEPRNPRCRKGKLDHDTMSSTTWIPKRTITVKGDGAVLSRIMHIVTLAVRDFVHLRYIEVIQNLQFVSIADFSGFLCKVGTRQKRKIGTVWCFPLVGCCNFVLLPHATRLSKCVLRLLTGDISIGTK